MKIAHRIKLLTLTMAFGLTACGVTATPPPATNTPPAMDEVAVQASASPAPPTASPTSTPTASPEPTATPTPPPVISVSENTNCRTGPGANFQFAGVLQVGASAEVLAKSTEPDYWYVTGGDLPEQGCWLWGAYAEVQGDTEALPIYTPAPSPTPAVGFDVFLKRITDCGYAKMIVFAAQNTGGERIWSGYVTVEDLDTGELLYKASERHPFSGPEWPDCPPDHGNELWPGQMKYIHVPVDRSIAGITAMGTITLCTADHQGGTCLTKYSYFNLP